MKHLSHSIIITAVLVTLSSPFTVRAADWANDTFSCSANVETLTPWYLVWHWGQWEKVVFIFNLTNTPDYRANSYRCYLRNDDFDFSYRYNCSFIGNYHFFGDSKGFFEIVLNSGVSKKEACQILFDRLGLKFKD